VGDILIAVNGREIRNPADVEDALRAAGRSGILEVLRSGRQMAFRFRV
jgi:type II secretory pathway component PulC